MITISLCMIVKNEEKVLARLLDSVQNAVDEIIIVDTGSTDATKEIAARYTDKIYDFKWINDFSAARNFAFDKATMDYQMWLDADDVLPKEQCEKLIELKKTLSPDTDMVTMKYFTHFDADGNPIFSSTRERLMKRIKNYRWIDPVHECIPLAGNIFTSDITVWHQKPEQEAPSTRNIDIYTTLEQSGKKMSPRQQYYFARELKDHRDYAKSAYYFKRFLDEGKGWQEDNIASCLNLAVCYHMLGEDDKILPALFRSFQYDSPRGDVCCEAGYYYKRAGNYAKALDWFLLATRLDLPTGGGFVQIDYWGYIPWIECCVMYCNMGDYEKAIQANEMAATFKPGNAAVEQNRQYLAKMVQDN